MVSALSDIIRVPGENIKFNGVFELNGQLQGYPSLAYTIEQKTVQKSFTVNNIDLVSAIIRIEKGLQNMNISISDQGVRTTYTIGNRNFTLPSKELLTQPRGGVSSFTKTPTKSNYSVQSLLNSAKK